MDAGAIKAAAAASAASYRSFADATRSVLDLLERLLPGCALYLSHLDRAHAVHRIVDTRAGSALGLRSNLATPLHESYDIAMAEERAPQLCNDVTADPIYDRSRFERVLGEQADPDEDTGYVLDGLPPRFTREQLEDGWNRIRR